MNAIKIENLEKNYKDFSLKIKELDIKKGYITGFIGPNGSGKTTTIRSILGLAKYDEGSIEVLGSDIFKTPKIKEEIGYVGTDTGYIEEMKIKNLKNSICSFYSNWDEEMYQSLIKKFKLNEKKKYKDLSKGMQKQFELCMALSHHPKLLIMDEPTANLDPIVRNEILELISENMVNDDMTVFYSSHITSDIEKCADYIIFINNGQIILQGEKDEILENHVLVKFKKELYDDEIKNEFIHINKNSFGYEGLASDRKKTFEIFGDEAVYEKSSLEEIMLFYNKGER